jgi:hypothetical protein
MACACSANGGVSKRLPRCGPCQTGRGCATPGCSHSFGTRESCACTPRRMSRPCDGAFVRRSSRSFWASVRSGLGWLHRPFQRNLRGRPPASHHASGNDGCHPTEREQTEAIHQALQERGLSPSAQLLDAGEVDAGIVLQRGKPEQGKALTWHSFASMGKSPRLPVLKASRAGSGPHALITMGVSR